MTRSEKLAKEEKIAVYIGSFETAKVIPHCNAISNLRYIGTDDECLYNGKEAFADVYEEKTTGTLYAVITHI